MTPLEELRRRKDEIFAAPDSSPLAPVHRVGFTGLSYFPEAPELRFRTRLGATSEEVLASVASDGAEVSLRRAGRITITIDAEPLTLSVFHQGTGGLFLPFRDATSGGETYGGGRYLDLHDVSGDGRLVVDFNLAYNPLCAYDDGWSCPLPPPENWLRVPIRAGERSFTTAEPD